MIRTVIQFVVTHGALISGLTTVARMRRRADLLILAYHNVVPTGEHVPSGDLSLHITQRRFARQLDELARTHEVVSLEALHDDSWSPKSKATKPRAVITFDDAYRGAVVAGIEELKKRNLPATIFVPPKFVGGGTFWWDRLATASGLDPALRDHALTKFAGRHDHVMTWAKNTGVPIHDVPSHMECATEAELHEAVSTPGITVGSHTWSHPDLAFIEGKELEYELTAPQAWLSERFGNKAINALTYPYGRATEGVWEASRHAGYDAGYMIQGDWITRKNVEELASFMRPRLNVPAGMSTASFMLRTAGLVTG